MTGHTKSSILATLPRCMTLRNKTYTLVRVNRMRELLKEFHDIIIERRWTFQCFADLIAAGLITRKPRHKNEPDGTIRQMSSMIAFTLKGANWLIKMGIEAGIIIKKQILNRDKEQDKRWPTREDYLQQRNEEMDEQERRLSENPIIKMVPNYD